MGPVCSRTFRTCTRAERNTCTLNILYCARDKNVHVHVPCSVTLALSLSRSLALSLSRKSARDSEACRGVLEAMASARAVARPCMDVRCMDSCVCLCVCLCVWHSCTACMCTLLFSVRVCSKVRGRGGPLPTLRTYAKLPSCTVGELAFLSFPAQSPRFCLSTVTLRPSARSYNGGQETCFRMHLLEREEHQRSHSKRKKRE